MSKLRVLCLHGFTSNGSVHAHQVRHLTRHLAEYEFLFPSGPHIISQLDTSTPSTKAWSDYVSSNSSGLGHRAWWFARDFDPTSPPANRKGEFEGLEESLSYIGNLIKETGPVHAIWGFSQGACFAAMLVALLGEGNSGHPLRKLLPHSQGTPTVGIFFSGFKARFEQYHMIYMPVIEVPTLHVMGEKDDAVSVKRSEELVAVCRNPKVLRHHGGHDIPKSEEDQDIILSYLKENLREKDRQSL